NRSCTCPQLRQRCRRANRSSEVSRTIFVNVGWRLTQTPYSFELLWRFYALLRLRWYFFLRCNFVFWLCTSHQPVVKPADNMLQPFDAMPRLARAGKLVRLVREPHHHRRNLAELQSAKHLLAA